MLLLPPSSPLAASTSTWYVLYLILVNNTNCYPTQRATLIGYAVLCTLKPSDYAIILDLWLFLSNCITWISRLSQVSLHPVGVISIITDDVFNIGTLQYASRITIYHQVLTFFRVTGNSRLLLSVPRVGRFRWTLRELDRPLTLQIKSIPFHLCFQFWH